TIRSEPVPSPEMDLDWRVHRLYRRAETMGLLGPASGPTTWDKPDLDRVMTRLLQALSEVGIATLAPPAGGFVDQLGQYARFLDHTWDALEDSPVPRSEIRELARVLGWDVVGRYAHASVQSLRR